MKKASFVCFAILLLAAAAAAVESSGAGTIDGLWVATVSESQVKFRLTVFGEGDKEEWNTSLKLPRTGLSGLEFEKDHSFKLAGDAGTITFTGKFSGTKGSGSFTFVADSGFVSFLEGKKFGRIDDKHLFFLLTGNIDKAYIQELERLGYTDVSSSRLVELAIHRVSLDYIKTMQSFGWQNLTLSKVVEFKIHGITKEYVDEMVKIGFKDLTPSRIVELKIHGLAPVYVKDIRSAGFPDLSLRQVLEFKIHGIDKDYIQYCRELLKGKKELTPELVVKMKITGI